MCVGEFLSLLLLNTSSALQLYKYFIKVQSIKKSSTFHENPCSLRKILFEWNNIKGCLSGRKRDVYLSTFVYN